jgi:hypothetical protein
VSKVPSAGEEQGGRGWARRRACGDGRGGAGSKRGEARCRSARRGQVGSRTGGAIGVWWRGSWRRAHLRTGEERRGRSSAVDGAWQRWGAAPAARASAGWRHGRSSGRRRRGLCGREKEASGASGRVGVASVRCEREDERRGGGTGTGKENKTRGKKKNARPVAGGGNGKEPGALGFATGGLGEMAAG